MKRMAVPALLLALVAVQGCQTRAAIRERGFEPVASSVLDGVRYDAASGTLSLLFDTGEVYHYRNVPASVYQGLLAASSKGRYFREHIKDRFEFTKEESETRR